MVDVIDQLPHVGGEGAFDTVVRNIAFYFVLQVGLGQLFDAARYAQGQGRLYPGQDLRVGQVPQGGIDGAAGLIHTITGDRVGYIIGPS